MGIIFNQDGTTTRTEEVRDLQTELADKLENHNDFIKDHMITLRNFRDKELLASDWTQGADVPSSIKNEYATYRAKLRDLPTTATKPNYSTLNGQNTKDWNIPSYMPTKPN